MFTARYGLGLNKAVCAGEKQQFKLGGGVVVVVVMSLWW